MNAITNPVTLLPDAELTREVGLLQRRAARKIEDAKAQLKRELTRVSELAERQIRRLDRGGVDFDLGEARQLADYSPLANAIATLREAEMMAAVVAELIEEPGQ